MNAKYSCRQKWTILVAAGAAALLCLEWRKSVKAAEPSAAGVEYFEKKVRPLLVKHCYECHSDKKQQGGLRLDSREGWAKGGDSGAAIAPGEPDNSLVLQALRYEGYEMPPSGKLKGEEIAVFEQWIKMGAPDPRNEAPPAVVAAKSTDLETGRQNWAYRPAKKTAVPQVRDTAWPRGDIDRFLLARLEEKQLAPASDASREVWARRIHFALTGLPPTPQQIVAFVNDQRPDAYERLVDDLLGSRQYGEHWGRHWLDVARYAESVTLRGLVFHEAWRYRDYVIDAFHQDLPYDQFVREQIAGDLLPADSIDERSRTMVATTFLMMGNTNLEEQDKRQLDMDVVDEQIDTISKALLAQTVSCARCHDHKFDPIPTRDYYALAGILRGGTAMDHANVSKWVEMPLPLEPEEETKIKQHETTLAALKDEIKKAKSQVTKLTAGVQDKASKGPAILAVSDLPGIVVDSIGAKAVGDWQHSQYSKRYIGDGYLHDKNDGKGAKTLTFQPEGLKAGRYEVRLAYAHGESRAVKIPVTILHADGETMVEVNQRETPPIDARFVSLGQFRFEAGNQGFVLVSNDGTTGHVTADAVQFLPVESAAKPQTAVATNDKTESVDEQQLKQLQAELRDMEARLKELTDTGPKRPMTMALREEGKFKDLPIHIRGSVHNLGEVAPRGFLQVASCGECPTISADESGRRQLADWLASPDNPLTARVMVNRVWHWLFGSGLVRTTDNFGTTGESPSHPQLLDHLTVKFVEQGWSLKKLVREIVLSHAYQMTSAPNEAGLAADPENRLQWRMNRQRLGAEQIRDAILVTSGQLKSFAGGSTIPASLSSDYGYKHAEPIRSVYVPVLRNSLPDLFEAFDFPDPSMVTGKRNASTVAPQALFMMNHPFVMEQAQTTAQRLLAEPFEDDAARMRWIYQATLGRAPTLREGRIIASQLGEPLLAGENSESERVERWTRIVQTLFASPEFRYVE
jgi:cytochrome c553